MIAEIEQGKMELVKLCKLYRANQLDLFGSVSTDNFHPETSDLDFIAIFADADLPGYARRHFEFAESLERVFNRRVDLLTERSISNQFFRESVNRSRITLYENHGEKVVA